MTIRCLYVSDDNGVCTNCGRRPMDGECGRTGEPVIRPRSVNINAALHSVGAALDMRLAPVFARLNRMIDRRDKGGD